MHSGITEKRECKQEKNGADYLIPDDPRRPYHFGNNGLCERAGVVGFYGTNEFDCID